MQEGTVTEATEGTEATTPPKGKAKGAKKPDKSNGTEEPLIGIDVKPGDQGSATQEDDGFEAPDYVPPDPTKEEIKSAEAVFYELQNRAREMGAERVIEALLQVVDTHPQFITPMDWQGEEDEEYREAPLVERIGGFLISGCPKLEVSQQKVTYVWRNKEKWHSKGVTIRSNAKSLGKMAKFLTNGVHAVVEMNFHLFKHMNPLQKVFSVYHALRHLDKEGAQRPYDFEGFFDEPELFGSTVFRELVTLANAMERGKERDLPYQLSLLDEVEGETAH